MKTKIGIAMLVGLYIVSLCVAGICGGWLLATALFAVTVGLPAYVVFAVYLITESEWTRK